MSRRGRKQCRSSYRRYCYYRAGSLRSRVPLAPGRLHGPPASTPASSSPDGSGTSSMERSVQPMREEILATYIDSSQVNAHILGELAFRLGRRLGILLKLTLQDVDFILAQARLCLVRFRWVRHAHHGRRLPMSHCGIPAQVLLRVRVVRDSLRNSLLDGVMSEVLEVVVIGLLKVFHVGSDNSGTAVPRAEGLWMS